MKHLDHLRLAAFGALCMALPLAAQIQDSQNDTIGTGRFRQHLGQVLDSDGSVATSVHYYSENSLYQIWLLADGGVTWSMSSADTIWSVTMNPVGELFDPYAQTVELTATGDVANYYLPHTAPGLTGVPAYHGIRRNDVYPDVDVQYYFGSGGPKMAFIFNPGSHPNDLLLQFSGQDSIGVDLQGFLRSYIGEKFTVLDQAIAYQLDGNNNVVPITWTPEYDIIDAGGLVHFTFDGFDANLPLIYEVGPAPMGGGGGGGSDNLDWSTMIGTDAGGAEGDFGHALDAADDGSPFVAGSTPDPTYPVANGALAYQGGFWDAYVMHFLYDPGNAATDAVQDWVTYYGGTDLERFTELHVSNDNTKVHCVGWTTSDDIVKAPAVDPMDGSYFQTNLKGSTDGVLVTLDPSNGFLLRGLYFGGNGDDMLTTITEDMDGHIFVAGTTNSTSGGSNSCNSPTSGLALCDPTTSNYYQTSNAGGSDCFIAALEDDYTLLWSTFYGSSADDVAYDLAYMPGVVGPSNTTERLVLVGTTKGTVPASGATGLFQQAGNGQENGFIATFKLGSFLGEPGWATNLQGIKGLYAASVHDGELAVLGVGILNDIGTMSCSPVSGSPSICNPGGNAYVEDVNNYQDHYLAQFTLPDGELVWSTFYGGYGDEFAEYARLGNASWHPFATERLYHLVHDDEGNLYMAGIVGQLDQLSPGTYPTLPAAPFYYQDYDTQDGNMQSEIVLACFLADRHLLWGTVFGSRFDHIDDNADAWKINYGSDYCYGLALVEGEALYWAGTTGGWDFDARCPYPPPGPQYCEDNIPFGGTNANPFDAFVARMSLANLNVSVPEGEPSHGMSVWPNPATDRVQVTFAGLDADAHLRLTDALGRVVASGRPGAPYIDVSDLPIGLYSLACLDANGVVLAWANVVVR